MFGPSGPSFLDLAVEAMSATDKGYDHLAPKFDTTPFRTPDDLLDQVAIHLQRGPKIGRLLNCAAAPAPRSSAGCTCTTRALDD